MNTLHLPYHCNTTRASNFVGTAIDIKIFLYMSMVTTTCDTFILEPNILLPAQLRPSTRKNL